MPQILWGRTVDRKGQETRMRGWDAQASRPFVFSGTNPASDATSAHLTLTSSAAKDHVRKDGPNGSIQTRRAPDAHARWRIRCGAPTRSADTPFRHLPMHGVRR